MPKLLITSAAKYFQEKGNTAITKNFIYQGCRSGLLPHCKIGNRYVIDTEVVERVINNKIDQSIQQKESGSYGQLRRID